MGKGGDVFVLDMGKPGAHRRSRARMISLMGLHRARRRESRRRHRDRVHRPAAGGEAVRGAADRQQRHRHRAPDDHARHGALAALGRRCSRCSTTCSWRSTRFDCDRARELLMRDGGRVPPDRRHPGSRLDRKAASRVSGGSADVDDEQGPRSCGRSPPAIDARRTARSPSAHAAWHPASGIRWSALRSCHSLELRPLLPIRAVQ